ncbi:MAG: hypothetical protein ACI4VU_06460 [Methanobrevibacter sp.]
MTYKEFREWLFKNWDAICEKYESALLENKLSSDNNYVDIKNFAKGIPNNFTCLKNNDSIYVLPTEQKPIRFKIKENDNENI